MNEQIEPSTEPAAEAAPLPVDETSGPPAEAIRPTSEFLRQVEAETQVNLSACYGCKKCSNGCPVTFAMDLHPYQVVRYVQLGLPERLKNSRTIWVCASCQTCLTRCPNEVDLPRLMDYLKETVVKEGRSVEERRVKVFNEQFLKEIKARGRVFEASLMGWYLFKTGGMFNPPEAIKNARLGLAMFKRGRLKLVPSRTKDRAWLKELFKK